MSCRYVFAMCLVLIACYSLTQARYLPTRSQDDRLDKLRDLLKDLLESEVEKTSVNNYERRLLYKRELPRLPQLPLVDNRMQH